MLQFSNGNDDKELMTKTYETTTKAGRTVSVTHDLSDDDCARIILTSEESPSDFALDMAHGHRSPKGLSEKQRVWLHILADEIAEPEKQRDNPSIPVVHLHALAGMFAQALDAGAKRVVIRTNGADGLVVLRLNKKRRINVTSAGCYGQNTFYGSIGVDDGQFRPSGNLTQATVDALAKFEANPAGIAAEYGRLTGECCFCGLTLTDARSVTVGYGPICANKFGLPWGGVTVLDQETETTGLVNDDTPPF